MARIGIDFGTTYTSAFYWQDGRYNSLLAAEEHQSPLVPSIALLYKDKQQYGFEARDTLKNPLLESNISRVFRGFKMLLGKMADDEMLRQRGFDFGNGKYSPEKIAEEFLRYYLDIALGRCQDGQIEKIVIGVPQIWFDEVNSISARDSLHQILQKFLEGDFSGKIKDVELESEPALACAYYADYYKNSQKANFIGNMLLIDYGGGTLDINLCRIHQKERGCEITILARTGKGTNDVKQNLVGKAGMAFLENAVRRATEGVNLSNAMRHSLEQSLESKLMSGKNTFANEVRKAVSKSDKEELRAQEFAELIDGKTSVTYGMLIDSYDEVIKPTLKNALDEIKEKMDNLNIKSEIVHQQDDFKIVLAGGFCNFYLTQKQVNDYFKIISNDPRLRGVDAGGAGLEYAIAYGASLVAAEVIQIKQTYPYSLGIEKEGVSDSDEEKCIWLAWTINEDLFYDKPKYVRRKGSDSPAVFNGNSIPQLFYDRKGDGKYILFKPVPSLKEIFSLGIDEFYKIGFSLDKVLNITLWLQQVDYDNYKDCGAPIKRRLPDLYSIFGNIQEVRKDERK
jgi:molecular chaperone DnaK